jgi:hypothetical protein
MNEWEATNWSHALIRLKIINCFYTISILIGSDTDVDSDID